MNYSINIEILHWLHNYIVVINVVSCTMNHLFHHFVASTYGTSLVSDKWVHRLELSYNEKAWHCFVIQCLKQDCHIMPLTKWILTHKKCLVGSQNVYKHLHVLNFQKSCYNTIKSYQSRPKIYAGELSGKWRLIWFSRGVPFSQAKHNQAVYWKNKHMYRLNMYCF